MKVKEKLDDKLRKEIKDIVSKAKKSNLVVPHTKAFETYPVKNEIHKGKFVKN